MRRTSALPGETLSLRLGFRRVEIDGDILRVNGRQVIFRGVNRHEIHPVLRPDVRRGSTRAPT